MPAPLISVIIPAYQQPAFLNAALASITAQTHPNVEILIVDDASGPSFVSQYQLPKNARLLINPARTAVAAISRNTTLAQAHGEFIAFLDQDDLFAPDKLAIQLAALQANPAAPLHFTHYQTVDQKLEPTREQRHPPTLASDHLRQLLRRNIIQCPSLVLMRRSAIDKLGGFDSSIRGAADWDMWLRAASLGPILFDPRPLVTYRTHPHQWSNSSLMLVKGSSAVVEKAAGWLPQLRPDLAWQLRYRQARWLRDTARVQLALGQETHLSMQHLRRAARLFPFDWRTYRLMLRAKTQRTQPLADRAPTT